MRRFSLGAPAPEREALLARWQEALRGVEDPRLELCRAMEDGNTRAFGQALAVVQKERERSLRAQRNSLGPEVLAGEQCLWVEGVALARLADGLTLRLAKELPLVPRAARTAKPVKVPPDAWKELWRAKPDD
ncbi:MAG TPA: hypothetical protein VEB43_16555 [Anaeromyxobacter sp.]|nr:hypothetical protein [Anaeromyxobacter sp.]